VSGVALWRARGIYNNAAIDDGCNIGCKWTSGVVLQAMKITLVL
jgi:hypothetical protein